MIRQPGRPARSGATRPATRIAPSGARPPRPRRRSGLRDAGGSRDRRQAWHKVRKLWFRCQSDRRSGVIVSLAERCSVTSHTHPRGGVPMTNSTLTPPTSVAPLGRLPETRSARSEAARATPRGEGSRRSPHAAWTDRRNARGGPGLRSRRSLLGRVSSASGVSEGIASVRTVTTE